MWRLAGLAMSDTSHSEPPFGPAAEERTSMYEYLYSTVPASNTGLMPCELATTWQALPCPWPWIWHSSAPYAARHHPIVPLAAKGAWYISSRNIHLPHCDVLDAVRWEMTPGMLNETLEQAERCTKLPHMSTRTKAGLARFSRRSAIRGSLQLAERRAHLHSFALPL